MTFQLIDLVFQSDRYYLLFNDLDAIKIAESNQTWQIIADDIFVQEINDCKLSEILKVTDKVILESKTNLSQLENHFRKKRKIVLTDQS
ncbi:hypothetical protein [Empedobacter tilapiae]|uniref:Uncharacterized protein n=1 Tax=Empedobacter tilapiae TaxID=2491114 RepID=A0A4Z1BUE3_9FLAO|nr:hypothetical protein [Empedobacter tilapiae]TGN27222.1 hypothetical protein E4J94_08390 [Empedobacter tilapiae]